MPRRPEVGADRHAETPTRVSNCERTQPLHSQFTKMTNLDMLLLKGASASNPEEGLQELRYTILTEGIPANSEGMVCSPHYPMRSYRAWAQSRTAQ